MPHKTKSKSKSEDIVLEEPPASINPYTVLGLEKDATSDQIKSAYRKYALKHHPDKASVENKENAHKQFQEIAFAYAILSDERRRKRYDTTGNTAESVDIDDDDFNWQDFFREQTAAMVDGSTIEKIKKEYQGSQEEIDDLLRIYGESEGNMDAVYEEIMCSNVLDDDERFRNIIDKAIQEATVESYKCYTKESKASKKNRIAHARREADEAMELAEELGVKEKLFGNGATKKKAGDEDALKALIQQRQKGRAENFFDQLEARYGSGGGGGGGKKGKRKGAEEPPEEAFQKNAKKSKTKS